ncbi:MAG TPA: hypothetical protein VH063_17630 [Gaiellaceae bacterium]|jgi:hypothetical protein|nr:hypothetical protein [Gaiellaceae bacterium]
MGSIRLPLAAAALAALLLSGCAASNTQKTISPAATLYVLDFGKAPTAAEVRPYEQVLRQVAHRCQDTEMTVAHYTAGTVKQIADDTGVHRTALEVLQRFPKTMNSDLTCTQRFTAYALLLEASA